MDWHVYHSESTAAWQAELEAFTADMLRERGPMAYRRSDYDLRYYPESDSLDCHDDYKLRSEDLGSDDSFESDDDEVIVTPRDWDLLFPALYSDLPVAIDLPEAFALLWGDV
jgi:hypothetical protein